MTTTTLRPTTGTAQNTGRRPGDPTRVVVYVRISSDDDLTREGVERQLADCRRHAERNGWTVTTVLEDNDISASEISTKTRPGYAAVVRMVQADEVDVVLCWSLDRLYRRPAELEQFLPLVDRHRVRLVTCDGTTVNPGEGALMVRMTAAFAAEEARKIKVRVRRKKLADAIAGKKNGRVPYGWNFDGTPKPGEAELVVELTERLLAGDSLKAIVRDWNAREVPLQTAMQRRVRHADGTVTREPFNRAWDSEGVRGMAARPTNAGLRLYRDAEGRQATATGYFDALVSEDQWRAVVSLFDSRKRPGPARTYLLSGLVGCGAPGCGGKLGGTRRNVTNNNPGATTKYQRVYRCMKCLGVSVPVDYVDDHVQRAVIDRLCREDVGDLLGSARESAAHVAAQKVEALRARKAEAARSFGRGLIELADLEAAVEELAPLLRMAEADAERLTSGRTAVLHGLTGPQAETQWADLPADRKRAVIALLATVTVLPRDRHHWTPADRVVITRSAVR